MPSLLAILHSPGSRKSLEELLLKKFTCKMKQLNIGSSEVIVNSSPNFDECLLNAPGDFLTIIIGWGLKSEPSWEGVFSRIQNVSALRQLIAIDLFEREGIDGRALEKPLLHAGKSAGRRIQLNNKSLFLEDNYLQSSTPYGLKKVRIYPQDGPDKFDARSVTFEPGEPAEIEIIRTIFELFVNHDHNRAEICNLLNAQQVRAPNKSKAWNQKTIKSILECPFYIGANRYREFIKHDVFIPIIEKSIYYEAQARIL